MYIKSIEIEGDEEKVKLNRTDVGAEASVERFTRRDGRHDLVIAYFRREESREERYRKAQEVAKFVYGKDPQGRAAATNSMVHQLMSEIDRVAD